MNLICPECRGTLAMESGRAQCLTNGGGFFVLFHRDSQGGAGAIGDGAMATLGGAATQTAATPCLRHPAAAAVTECGVCGQGICAVCCREAANGAQLCPVCAGEGETRATASAGGSPSALGECAQHPGQPAFVRCDACGAPMCKTCNFSLPDGQHACPKCVASAGKQGLSPKRKRMMIGAYALAIFALVALVFLIVVGGEAAQGGVDEQVLGILMMIFVMGPSVAGAGLGFGALDKRRGNTAAIWIAALLNLGVVVLFILLCLAGLAMS